MTVRRPHGEVTVDGARTESAGRAASSPERDGGPRPSEGSSGRSAEPRGVAGNVALLTLANFATPVLGIATAPLLARGLGVDGRGAVAAATAPLLLAIAVGTLGLTDALIARVAPAGVASRSAIYRLLAVMLASGAMLTGGSFLLAPVLAPGQADLQRFMVIGTAFVIPALLIAVIRAVAQALERWRVVAVEQVLSALLRLGLVLVLFVSGHMTVFTATLATACPLVLGAVVYAGFLRRHRAWIDDSDADFGRLLNFGARMWLGYLGGILLTRLDQLILVPLASARALGIYVVAVTVAELLLVVTNAVRDVTFAADAARRDNERAATISRLSTAACVIATVGFAVVGPYLVPLVFGRAFAPAMPSILLLMAAIVVLAPGSVAGALLIARGFPGRRSVSLLVGATVNVVALLLLVPRFDAEGAALATLLGNALFAGLNMVFLARVTDARPTTFVIAKPSDLRMLQGMVMTQWQRHRPSPV